MCLIEIFDHLEQAGDCRLSWPGGLSHLNGRTGTPRSFWGCFDTKTGEPGGQPHVYVTTAISLAEFMFMKKIKGQWVAGVVGKGRFSLLDFLPEI